MIRLKERSIQLKSSFENLYLLEKFIDEICDDYHIKNTYYGNISVAVYEAVSNAIIHGNKNDSEKLVRVIFRNLPTGLLFRIEDEGNGFDYNNIPDLADETANTLVFPGKGLYLVKALADNVSFDGKGNIVEIQFNISSINYETSIDRASKLNDYFKTFTHSKSLNITNK